MIINANRLSFTLIMKEVRITITGQREAAFRNRLQIVHKCVMLMEVIALTMIYTLKILQMIRGILALYHRYGMMTLKGDK